MLKLGVKVMSKKYTCRVNITKFIEVTVNARDRKEAAEKSKYQYQKGFGDTYLEHTEILEINQVE